MASRGWRKCHDSIFQQHKLKLPPSQKCFQKVQKSQFLPKSSILSPILVLHIGLWRAWTFRYLGPLW